MSRRVTWAVGLGFVVLAALGVWLWWRHGLTLWLDAAVAFCS